MTEALNLRLSNLLPNPDWAKLPLFDRTNWARVRFGDVVENLNEMESNPEAAGLKRFIGLEHLEPGSLHIRSWGNVADGTTFTRRCRPGQVLFGKRRAYQRKVAVAEFDAVVSGDIYVLVPKKELLLPELLPFICLSERFFQHAVGTSAGSLSPRTNWSSLASFEFDLPPLDQQRRIAEILWAIDEVQQQYISTEAALQETRSACIDDHFKIVASNGHRQNLASVAQINYGITLGGHRTNLPEERTYLRVANVLRERIDLSELKTINCTEEEASKFTLIDGDVLVVEGHASADEIGRAAVWRSEMAGILHQNHLIRVRCSELLIPEYLNFYLNSSGGRVYFRSRAKSSSGLNTINSTVVKEFPVPIIQVAEQKQLTATVQRLDSALKSGQAAQSGLGAAMRQFLNEVLT